MALPSALMGKHRLAPKVSGKIRPGIQILTKKGQENTTAVEIYNQGIAAGLSFDDIADTITRKTGLQALRPVNTPYFTVRRADFGGMPELADLVMEKYGEIRDDGVRRLYRFPVVFGTDEITRILDFKFQTFTASGLQYWSDESDNGQARLCKTFAPLEKAKASDKVIRLAAGRSVIPRPENRGLCDPLNCAEFQSRACTMRGRLLFYLPGIPGAGLIELPTGSKNFGVESESVLRDILQLGRGQLPTLIDGRPVFYITKRLRNVPMINYDEGRMQRTDQWIIEIEADIDMSRLRAPNTSLLLGNGNAAVLALSGQRSEQTIQTAHPAVDAPVMTAGAGLVSDNGSTQRRVGSTKPPKQQDPHGAVKALRREMATLAETLGVDPKQYGVNAARKWGDTWSRTETSLKLAIEDIKAIFQVSQSIKTHLAALGIEFSQFDLYAKGAFSDHWRFDLKMLQSVEEELMDSHTDRENYIAAVIAVAESVAH